MSTQHPTPWRVIGFKRNSYQVLDANDVSVPTSMHLEAMVDAVNAQGGLRKPTFEAFEIIAANGDTEEGWNLYTPAYGDKFIGNFGSITEAAVEAVRLGGECLTSVKVL